MTDPAPQLPPDDAAWPELAHTRMGEGEPLLLIHSLGGTRAMWEPVLGRLAAEHDVIAVDVPGFAESPALPDDIEPSPRNLGLAALAHLRRLGIEEDPHIAGISHGSFISIETARLGRARSVTALCTAGFWEQPLGDRRNWARWLARGLWPYLKRRLETEDGRERILGGVIRHPGRLTAEQARRIVHSYAFSPGFAKTNSLMRNSIIGRLDPEQPHTLAWAEHDRLVRNRPLPGATVGPAVRQLQMPGVSHVPTWDDPALVAQTILETTALARSMRTAA